MVTYFILSTFIFSDKVALGGDSIITSRQNCLFMTKLLPPPSPTIAFVYGNPFALRHAQHKHPVPFPTKTKFYDLKRTEVEAKKSFSSFICFFFKHKKDIICLKSKICHYSQSLVQTGSIPSKTGVPLS